MEDKILGQLKDEMRDFSAQPDEKMWKNISANLNNKKFSWLKTISIAGLTVLAIIIGALIYSPGVDKSKTNALQIADNTNTVSKNNVQTPIDIDNNGVDVVDTKLHGRKSVNSGNEPTEQSLQTVKQPSANAENSLQTDISSTKQAEIFTPTDDLQKNSNIVQKETDVIAQSNQKTALSSSGHMNDEPIIEDLFVPNAFQPESSEDLLRTFKPLYKEDMAIYGKIASYELNIFTRKGTNVFSTKDINTGWDGKIKGKLADQGTYVYYIKYTDTDGKSHSKKGILWLNR